MHAPTTITCVRGDDASEVDVWRLDIYTNTLSMASELHRLTVWLFEVWSNSSTGC